jgi:hypothetical protein
VRDVRRRSAARAANALSARKRGVFFAEMLLDNEVRLFCNDSNLRGRLPRRVAKVGESGYTLIARRSVAGCCYRLPGVNVVDSDEGACLLVAADAAGPDATSPALLCGAVGECEIRRRSAPH